MQHDVQASREGTSSLAVKSSIQKGTWLYRRQAESKTLRACQNTPQAAEDLTKETMLSSVGEIACLRCEAIADQTDTQKVRVTRHYQTLAGDSIVVAGAGSTARVHGWIMKDRVDCKANLPDLGADRKGSRGEGDLWQMCNMRDMRKKADRECGRT